jgi:hypothetical protein
MLCDKLPGDRLKDICKGTALIDGKPITEDIRQFYIGEWTRSGILPQWDVTMPARGFGDVVAKLAHYIGIKKLVKAMFPVKVVAGVVTGGCGCPERQEALNRAIPFGR